MSAESPIHWYLTWLKQLLSFYRNPIVIFKIFENSQVVDILEENSGSKNLAHLLHHIHILQLNLPLLLGTNQGVR